MLMHTFPFHAVFAAVLLASAAVIAVLLVRRFHGNTARGFAKDRGDSLEILKNRLAKGEIDPEEYDCLKDILEGDVRNSRR